MVFNLSAAGASETLHYVSQEPGLSQALAAATALKDATSNSDLPSTEQTEDVDGGGWLA